MTILKRAARAVFVIGAMTYALLSVLIAFGQESMVFPAPVVAQDHDYNFPPTAEDFWLDRPDGTRLHGVRYSKGGAAGVLLYFHGNGAHIGSLHLVHQVYGPLGYDVVGIDYRGYGKSTGERSEEAMLQDALAFYDHVVSAGAPAPLIVGRSLGATFATYVAANRSTSQLVLYAPPASIADKRDFLACHEPIFPSAR